MNNVLAIYLRVCKLLQQLVLGLIGIPNIMNYFSTEEQDNLGSQMFIILISWNIYRQISDICFTTLKVITY